MTHNLINGDCLEVLRSSKAKYTACFADPFDNIGLGYDHYDDRMPDDEYLKFLEDVLTQCLLKADIVWWSFNAKWTFAMGRIFERLIDSPPGGLKPRKLEGKPCVQAFTFGQHNKNDLGNNHRPLWRLKWDGVKLYPKQIKVPSWRLLNGDKRAAPGGRVPGDVFDMQYPGMDEAAVEALAHKIVVENSTGGANYGVKVAMDHARHGIKLTLEAARQQPGDVFDYPRVTGNSKQRRKYHPTQLHEELVERCLLLSTQEGDTVLDPFGGTGTTLRVCERINRSCTLIELDPLYCKNIRKEHPKLKFKKIAA